MSRLNDQILRDLQLKLSRDTSNAILQTVSLADSPEHSISLALQGACTAMSILGFAIEGASGGSANELSAETAAFACELCAHAHINNCDITLKQLMQVALADIDAMRAAGIIPRYPLHEKAKRKRL